MVFTMVIVCNASLTFIAMATLQVCNVGDQYTSN